MYEVVEVSIADARRFLQYKHTSDFEVVFNLKGFDYLWIIQARSWKAGETILDLGCGYSRLPIYLSDHFGCEVWAVDDFGLSSGENYWTRGKEPLQHIQKYPQVKFVLERLGDVKRSSLPLNYFDCIYSASTLEHIPPEMINQVWQHMDVLLKPNGELLHAVEIRLPTQRGMVSLLKALALDHLKILIPPGYCLANAFFTPRCYLQHVKHSLGIRIPIHTRQLNPLTISLDPAVVLEPIDWAYHRMIKDGMNSVTFSRMTSLLIHLKKLDHVSQKKG
jgi:SAM-dependent methyltransferase